MHAMRDTIYVYVYVYIYIYIYVYIYLFIYLFIYLYTSIWGPRGPALRVASVLFWGTGRLEARLGRLEAQPERYLLPLF